MARIQTVTTATSSDSVTITATWPASTTPGSLLVATVGQSLVYPGDATLTAPTGWTLVGTNEVALSTKMAMFARVDSAARSGGETFTCPTYRSMVLTLAEYDATGPLDSLATNAANSNTAAVTGSATTGGEQTWVAAVSNRNNDTQTPPAEWTQVAQDQSIEPSTGNRVNAGTYERLNQPQGTPDVTVPISASRPWAVVLATFEAAPSVTEAFSWFRVDTAGAKHPMRVTTA